MVLEVRDFWSRVDKSDGCWRFRAAAEGDYGRLGIEGRTRLAHCVAWALVHGPIPEGMSVLHHCDNRPCVRPDHLYVGTQGDNVRDAVERGRHVSGYGLRDHRGAGHPMAKTTESSVRSIRALAATGQSVPVLASRFGLSVGQTKDIISGRAWAHVK